MKINGYSFQCEYPFFVYLKRHYCPCCGNRLVRQQISKVIHSDSEEAKNYDFDIADMTVKGNVKFSHIAFSCLVCKRNYTVKEIKGGHYDSI